MEITKPYLYEPHLHTAPVSRCGRATVREMAERFLALGYAGIFITNHFIGGNINISPTMTYEEVVHFYFDECDHGAEIGRELGIKVFTGMEFATGGGTEFLVYGLGREWFLEHRDVIRVTPKERLTMMQEAGALIVQAHPFREAAYIPRIALFPRDVQGVEIYNAQNPDDVNEMAEIYCRHYGLLPLAGSDIHSTVVRRLGGLQSDTPIEDEQDFIRRFLAGELTPFRKEL